MKKFALKTTLPLALLGTAGVAVAALVIQFTIQTPIALSDGGNGDKPKLVRASNGLLVAAYGDSPAGAGLVYDTKADAERKARDVFVRTCNPATTNCDVPANWSPAVNVSNSALQSSISTAWQGPAAGLLPYPGDIDKVNIKANGPVVVMTWVGNYCPDGDLKTSGIQTPVQRAVRYLERDSRIIPFACTWLAYSKDNGVTWSAPIQLSTGERDAKQDSSSGNFDSVAKTGRIIISWQEDPRGLQLGEADGPGDGASGANVSNGTDVWYAYANVDLSVPSTPADDFVLSTASPEDRAIGYRLTDNFTNTGIGGTDEANPVFDGSGNQVDKDTIESGQTGAARPNIGMVGGTAIVAYEETKGSAGLDEGKFIRYHAFPFASPPTTVAGKAGCVISDPLKNGRRVRFLTQSPTDAGSGGIQIAIFWKEGIYDKGGPSDIVVRRGMGGLQPANMVPTVDAACATSDYTTAIGLSNQRAENISSRASVVTAADDGLTDDTERNFTENALAHRGVLRGGDLWIGYNYTADLVRLWAQLDNYNFWVRKYTWNGTSGSWGLPVNLSNVTDKTINVREPRFFGTPASNTNAGFCDGTPTQNTAFCQDRSVIYVAWGTQTNVSPFDPVGPVDLGLWITVSNDGGATYAKPVKLSTVQGPSSQDPDGESAYETQPQTRPDGREFYAVWNQFNPANDTYAAEYTRGTWTLVDTGTGGGGGGGCTTGNGGFDPTLLLLAGLGVAGVGLRRVQRARRR
ncbi:choice-of-anchor O protein [Azohydromonas sediminis]|uniref:choice-of-anchor O protein n=1 Tax=Azohydromonas sediminis TaxID=2259674 RepID=UPI000E652902|nr:choice-of-anchor O protein [Azohydromonas sediminis]